MIIKNFTHIKRLNFLQTRDCYTSFDGTNDYIDITNNPDITALDWTDEFSVFIWYYKFNINVSTPFLGSFRGGGSPLGWFFQGLGTNPLFPTFTRALRVQLRSQPSDVIDVYSQIKMNDNAWNCVGFCYGGTGQGSDVQFYADGVASPLPNILTQGVALSAGSIISGEPMTIGALIHPNVSNYGQGNLMHLSVFDRKLTALEAQNIFNKGRISPNYADIPNLLNHYTLRNFDFQDRIGGTFGTPSGMTAANIICS